MNKPDRTDEYRATKVFVDEAWKALSKEQQKVLGNIIIAGHGEDEVAKICGQDVLTIERLVRESYELLAQKGYDHEDVHKYANLMMAYQIS